MDVDRKMVLQLIVSVVALLLFVAGLAVLSTAYGTSEPVDNESISGDLEGDFTNLSVSGGEVAGSFEGHLSNDFEADVDGTLDGTADNGTLTADVNGTISGAVDGTATGDVTGTVDEEAETFEGTFNGTVNGSTENALSSEGGLAVLGLIALFIVLLPILGYLVERNTDDDDDD